MTRKEELLSLIDNNKALVNLVDEIIFIEEQLVQLKKYPLISVNPNNPLQQKSTAAAKLYKELLQQYNNSIKVLTKMTDQNENDEESPLRKWLKSRNEENADEI